MEDRQRSAVQAVQAQQAGVGVEVHPCQLQQLRLLLGCQERAALEEAAVLLAYHRLLLVLLEGRAAGAVQQQVVEAVAAEDRRAWREVAA